MSWLLGNSDTSFGSDLGALWTNATTGNLTDAQKIDIAASSTKELTSCSEDPNSPECQALYQANLSTVKQVSDMNRTCDGVLNVPGFGCISSWTHVIYYVIGGLAAFALLYALILNLPLLLRKQ